MQTDFLEIPEEDALRLENLQLRLQLLQHEFSLARVQAETRFAQLTEQMNATVSGLCTVLGVTPDEYDLDIAQRRFVPKPGREIAAASSAS